MFLVHYDILNGLLLDCHDTLSIDSFHHHCSCGSRRFSRPLILLLFLDRLDIILPSPHFPPSKKNWRL